MDPGQALARRLRALREQHWPDQGITQSQLAEALGAGKPLSISLISSWENSSKPVPPPVNRLAAYATFFATRRSVEGPSYRLLPLDELSADERAAREDLLHELTRLRTEALTVEPTAEPTDSLWHFPDTQDVTIVCAKLPDRLLGHSDYTDPSSPDYVELYTYADLDALIELYGHLRATNPMNQVTLKRAPDLTPDDYPTHLVLLGGVDWNTATREVLDRINVGVRSRYRDTEADPGGIDLEGSGETLTPQFDKDNHLIEDVAHFYRGPNPFNSNRTVTICYGMYAHGTYGAVRALTDARFRDSNYGYIRERLKGARSFSIISRVLVVQGKVVTPDWTQSDSILHE
jgi:transcriptional regulator with XRE-family HTH domain